MSDGPRNFRDPKYVAWRKRVYARDGYKCRMPGCAGGSKQLNAHHIKLWAKFPELRFIVTNGITLCKVCHERIKGIEQDYEDVFSRITNEKKNNLAMQMLMVRYSLKPNDAEKKDNSN